MGQRDGAWWEKEINNNNKITPAGWSEAEGEVRPASRQGLGCVQLDACLSGSFRISR